MDAPEFDLDDIIKGAEDLVANKPVVPAFDSISPEIDTSSFEDKYKKEFVDFFVRERVLPMVTIGMDPRLFAPELKDFFVDTLLGTVANLNRIGRVDVADVVRNCTLGDVIDYIPGESERWKRKLAGCTTETLIFLYNDRMIKRLEIILHAAENAQKL